MLADAADESLALTRLLDAEDTDPAVLNREVHCFHLRLTALFSEDRRCLTATGYTQVMLQLLREQIVWTVGDCTGSIGCETGVPHDMLDRCFGRMQAFLALARAALAAEFPSFELAQAFQVFDLVAPPTHAVADRHLQRLSQTLNLNAVELKAQWRDFLPRAQSVRPAPSRSSNKDAWKMVVERVENDKRLQAAHPFRQLQLALVAYAAFGVSSSGVEQKFSKSALKFTDRMGRCNDEQEESFLRVSMDLPDRDVPATLQFAIKLWHKAFPVPRGSPYTPRFDRGVKRKRLSSGDAESAFVQQRRAAARAAASSLASGAKAAAIEQLSRPAAPAGSWTAGHSSELAFLSAKLHSKAVDAAAEHTLLPAESTPELQHAAAEKAHKRVSDQRARERKACRAQATTHGVMPQGLLRAIRGKKVFVHSDCRKFPGIRQAVVASGLTSARLSEADVFVVVTPGRADSKVMFASALQGAYQISPKLLVSGRGAAVKMTSQSHLPKVLFVTHAFIDAHRDVVALARRLVTNIPNCMWEVRHSRWEDLKTKVPKSNLYAAVCPGEAGGDKFAGHKNTFLLDALITRVCKIAGENSVTGLC